MASRITRIFSDLHFQDDISWLQSTAALEPMLDGADEVIVNGDAIDDQIIANGSEKMAHLVAFIRSRVPRAQFITGNHDPDISSLHELFLAEGRIWITHGDVLFRDMVPWSSKLKEIRRRLAPLEAALSPHELTRIETRIRLHRKISIKLPCDHDPLARGFWHRAYRAGQVLLHPGRVLALVRSWYQAPRLAEQLAAEQRPQARFIINGHTHAPGIWRRPNQRVIINTGSFCPPRGGLVVEIADDTLSVRQTVRDGERFRPGRVLATFPILEKSA